MKTKKVICDRCGKAEDYYQAWSVESRCDSAHFGGPRQLDIGLCADCYSKLLTWLENMETTIPAAKGGIVISEGGGSCRHMNPDQCFFKFKR